jgi:hypothetical protein
LRKLQAIKEKNKKEHERSSNSLEQEIPREVWKQDQEADEDSSPPFITSVLKALFQIKELLSW